jgi:uncharacterized protein (TIGR03435 family)
VIFEVVSIKPSDPNASGGSIRLTPGRFVGRNVTMKNYVQVAYDKKDFQVIGGPKWAGTERYDIDARLTTPQESVSDSLNKVHILSGMRSLLADRCGLTIQRESKLVLGYAIVLARSGPKLKTSSKVGKSSYTWSHGHIAFASTSIEEPANLLTQIMETPVVDKTETSGKFDFTLQWTPDGENSDEKASWPSMVTALQEQLGLKLQSEKVPMELISIEHLEKPSAN